MRSLLLLVAFGLRMTPNAMARQVVTPANTQGAHENARVAIQDATDQLNQALLRRDVEGVLTWLAPDFELGRRQYRVRDREWMRRALPAQFQLMHYTVLSAKVRQVDFKEGVALADGAVEAHWELNEGVVAKGRALLSGRSGGSVAEWVQTAQGWRLRGNSGVFDEELLGQAAPDASLRPQPGVAPDSPAAAIGLPLEEPKTVFERGDGQFETSLAFSPNGQQLVFDSDQQTLRVVEPRSGALLREFPSTGAINTLAYTRDGSLWASDGGGAVRQMSPETGTPIRKWDLALKNNSRYKTSVAPDGQVFAVMQDREVQVWNSAQTQPVVSFPVEVEWAYSIECSPDGASLAIATAAGVEVRNARSGQVVHRFQGEKWGGFLSDGKTLVTMRLNRSLFSPLEKEGNDVLRFRSIATGEIGRQVPIPVVWNGELQKIRQQLDAGESPWGKGDVDLPSPAISPDGRVAVSPYYGGSMGIWDTQTGKIVRVLRGFSRIGSTSIPTLTFSLNGQLLAEDSGRGEIAVWDIGRSKP